MRGSACARCIGTCVTSAGRRRHQRPRRAPRKQSHRGAFTARPFAALRSRSPNAGWRRTVAISPSAAREPRSKQEQRADRGETGRASVLAQVMDQCWGPGPYRSAVLRAQLPRRPAAQLRSGHEVRTAPRSRRRRRTTPGCSVRNRCPRWTTSGAQRASRR